jgi:glycyl-tRNA synthetase (class II)
MLVQTPKERISLMRIASVTTVLLFAVLLCPAAANARESTYTMAFDSGSPDYATHNPGCPDGGAMAWPREIAPFVVEILPLNVNNEETRELSEQLYAALEGNGVGVLLDDRDDRAGVKFKDADLFGSPVIVVIGERNLKEGRAEVRIRDRNVTALMETAGIESYVLEALGKGK